MADIRRFCCSRPSAHSTVLGVDKTFNLGELHVTATVFKNLAVGRQTTDNFPISARKFGFRYVLSVFFNTSHDNYMMPRRSLSWEVMKKRLFALPFNEHFQVLYKTFEK
jgi:hypothetical protein